MANPIITITDTASSTLPSLSFGIVDIESISDVSEFYVWNNKDGVGSVSDAISATITTKTLNGYNSGDTIPNGKEVVENKIMEAQATSLGDIGWTAVGGTTTLFIGNTVEGVIEGDPGGTFADVKVRLNVPAGTTPGDVSFYIRINYSFV